MEVKSWKENDGLQGLSRQQCCCQLRLYMLDSMIKWPDNMDTSAWYYEAMQEATNSHDYDMFEGAEYETWTALEENRDWAALEQDWMNAHRGGGEVM